VILTGSFSDIELLLDFRVLEFHFPVKEQENQLTDKSGKLKN
jgi:hypothetical protein